MLWSASNVRTALAAAVAATIAFAAFTAWWLANGGSQLDATMLRFSGWLLRGWVDVVIPPAGRWASPSSGWPLGEPQFGLAAAATIATVLVVRRSYRAAAVVFGGFGLLSAIQLAIVVTLAVVRHDGLGVAALVRLYPSGHAARVPFLGTAVAAVAPRRAGGGYSPRPRFLRSQSPWNERTRGFRPARSWSAVFCWESPHHYGSSHSSEPGRQNHCGPNTREGLNWTLRKGRH